MKQFVVITVLLSASLYGQCQNALKPFQLNLGIGTISANISGEWKLGHSTTFYTEAGYGVFSISSLNENKYTHATGQNSDVWMPILSLSPYLKFENRFYTNLQKSKNVRNNAANFWSVLGRVNIPNASSSIKTNYRLGATYGLQRNLGKANKLMFAFQAGYGLWINSKFTFIGHGPMLNTGIHVILK